MSAEGAHGGTTDAAGSSGVIAPIDGIAGSDGAATEREGSDGGVNRESETAGGASEEPAQLKGTGDHFRDIMGLFATLDPPGRYRVLQGMQPGQRRSLLEDFARWSLDGQLAPPGDWRVWLIRAGRGFGKTRAGAEWVSEQARRMTAKGRIALVGATIEDARKVMVEGESGLLAVARTDEECVWKPHEGEVHFASGAVAHLYSAEVPEKLRGPQHHAAWCDEIGKWRLGDATWDNLMMTMRLSDEARVVVTTTPRATSLMRRVMALPGLVETGGGTAANLYLPRSFVEAMEQAYGGTRLGRQEIGGEMIDDVAGALWTRGMIEAGRAEAVPDKRRVVVGVDPPAGSASGEGDACGIVAVALGSDGCGYVLMDASVSGTPNEWALAVADCAKAVEADRVIAEANQGGEMVRSVLTAASSTLPLTLVRASRGKVARAEPVAALYERGRVKHLGVFPQLEDELCGLVRGGDYEGPGRSPDRADALVWAVTELMLVPRSEVAVRGL